MTDHTPDEGPEGPEDAAYDPAEYTVDEVVAHLDANPGDVDSVLAAEKDGKARKGILGYEAPTVEDLAAASAPEPWNPVDAGLEDDGYDRVVVYP